MRTLSRQDFDAACQRLMTCEDELEGTEYARRLPVRGWTWREHALLKEYGYLTKSVSRQAKQSVEQESEGAFGVIEQEDEAALHGATSDAYITVELSIAYSASFQVPVLYFAAKDAGGAPVSLDTLTSCNLFRAGKANQYPIQTREADDQAAFPTISAGAHPVTGQHTHFLHPCNTSAFVEEILASSPTQDEPSLAFLKTWLMLTNTLIDLS